MDFDVLRERMVSEQLIPRGIHDKRVLDAFRKVPRHKFVEEKFIPAAYADHPLPIGENQTISQPYIVALMTELLNLEGGEKVLEVGAGSGYQAAILAGLAKEVYSVERIPGLVKLAENNLKDAGAPNVKIKQGDGTLGLKESGPYDAIIVTAGAPGIPSELVDQLKDGGRLVIPVGGNFSQMLTLIEKKGGKIIKTDVCGCMFVPLIGKDGWSA